MKKILILSFLTFLALPVDALTIPGIFRGQQTVTPSPVLPKRDDLAQAKIMKNMSLDGLKQAQKETNRQLLAMLTKAGGEANILNDDKQSAAYLALQKKKADIHGRIAEKQRALAKKENQNLGASRERRAQNRW